MNKIILIGTGNIGKRHLQAVINSNLVSEIYCYDLYQDALKSIPEFCQSNEIPKDKIFLEGSFEEILKKIDENSIVIVATTANGRMELLVPIIQRKPKAIVLEKPVVQYKEQYEELEKLAEQLAVNIYVNFIAHAQNFYKRIYKELEETEELSFYTSMPRWGLSTVGIHQIELFLWLSKSKSYEIAYSNSNLVYEQKRKGFEDVAGTILIKNEKGHIASIRSLISDKNPSSIQICSNKNNYTIYESLNKLIIADKTGVHMEDLNVKFVSQYMNEVVDDIFTNKKVYLPTIASSRLAHNVLFDFLRIHKLEGLNIT
ncbi:Gfo/Idh/MocA family oxidoreductase [Aestuariibaculum sp. M13]|uniref:Gfo/Idh/MocA family oxidoreductase n=1 Tax=Aestuariibaculum sp. M13 TaxID=2967132 RepID=UPI002159FD43|nr:Gfo/Idh/MocA family oxidoreductase [Aestuariibaculum sp. M13]MCR8667207.1 Gfo/Idh/MocA family oxidoreductase [Aestuariibaculum sp. M13]